MHFIAVSALVCTFICYCIGVHFTSVIALVHNLLPLLLRSTLYFCYCIGVYFISVIALVYTLFLLWHRCTLHFCYCIGVHFTSVIALVYTLLLLLQWCILYFCYCIGVYFISVIASVVFTLTVIVLVCTLKLLQTLRSGRQFVYIYSYYHYCSVIHAVLVLNVRVMLCYLTIIV